MDRKEALELVREKLTEHRYIHTVGVMESAIELAGKFGANQEKAEIAGIFHDYAKFRDKSEMEQIIINENMPKDLLMHSKELWHAPVGAYLVRQEVGIEDPEILSAIRFHTSGRPDMNKLEKVIFLADYIEPNRQFPGVEEVRELAKVDLDKAIIMALQNTIKFLVKQNQAIYPDTIDTYNWLILTQH